MLLQVILQTQECTLEQLSVFQPGAELSVALGPGTPVKISLNGRVMGDGRLVQVGERMAVQVTGWY